MSAFKNSAYHANGKFLITGEYMVLKGARVLAVPLGKGQLLHLRLSGVPDKLYWTSLIDSRAWFEAEFDKSTLEICKTTAENNALYIQKLLRAARELNKEFLSQPTGFYVDAHLEFEREWGFGSSSSLLANIAQWAGCDAMQLHRATSAGSGYDVACAITDAPILYQLTAENYSISPLAYNPPFAGQLYFVYLGNKQDSQREVAKFKASGQDYSNAVERVTELTDAFVKCRQYKDFTQLMYEHEHLIGSTLGRIPVQQKYFSDFDGQIKSLGAWGGDFCLVASQQPQEYVRQYFANKELSVLFEYNDLAMTGKHLA